MSPKNSLIFLWLPLKHKPHTLFVVTFAPATLRMTRNSFRNLDKIMSNIQQTDYFEDFQR